MTLPAMSGRDALLHAVYSMTDVQRAALAAHLLNMTDPHLGVTEAFASTLSDMLYTELRPLFEHPRP